jgi:hypothetical protein
LEPGCDGDEGELSSFRAFDEDDDDDDDDSNNKH